MKEINEHWQMKIFDLLEGNLSEKDKKNLLMQIEKEEVLKNEYALMKQTYLQPEYFTFENKDKLYKKAGGNLTFIFSRRYAAVASVIIICGSLSVFYYWNRNNHSTHNSISKNTNSPSNLDNVKVSKKTIELPKTKTYTGPNWENKNYQAGETPIVSEDIFKKITLEKPTKQVETVVKNKKDSISPALPYSDIAIENTVVSENNDTGVVLDQNATHIQYRKKRSLGYRLLNNGRTMLANLQMPKVNFKSEKRNDHLIPRVKMQISTPKTEIIATLID